MSKDLDTVSVSIAAGGGGFTPGFMCPKVLRGVEKLSPAADMYAFGVLILNTIHPPAAGQVSRSPQIPFKITPMFLISITRLWFRLPFGE